MALGLGSGIGLGLGLGLVLAWSTPNLHAYQVPDWLAKFEKAKANKAWAVEKATLK